MPLLLLACSEYNLDKSRSPPGKDERDPLAPDADTGDSAEDVATETAETGPTDTGDPPLEESYCTPFDDFDGWAYLGEGEWYVESGMLTEGRNGLYEAVAYLHDLGAASHFMIQADTAWGPSGNDTSGLVWGLDGSTYYAARWDDPQNYYDRYDPTGRIDISACDGSGCTELASDASADLYWPEDMSFVTWSVEVDGPAVTVVVNGTTAFSQAVPEVEGSGPGVVGVYSNDNDGGVWFDNFCVWVET